MRYALKTQLFEGFPPHIVGYRSLFAARVGALFAWIGGCEVIEIHDLGAGK